MLLSLLRGELNLPAFLQSMLVSLPGFLLALSMHEAAHAFAAYRFGDPTAKAMGRLTLNPLKHLDPIGFACMFVVGVGWAKPVPVDPRYFRNLRRDDLVVSIAGITANLLQFVVGSILLYIMLALAIARVPASAMQDGYILTTIDGVRYGITSGEAFRYATGMAEYLIAPFLGGAWRWVYEVIVQYAVVNLYLAVFNLLPVPPLDGYHVLNDLVLRKSLFAPQKVMRIGQAAILMLAVTGWLGKGLSAVVTWTLGGMGTLAAWLFGA